MGAIANPGRALDLSRSFLPEALAGTVPSRVVTDDERRSLNQIRAASYLHVFDLFESAISEAARARATDAAARELLAPLIRFDAFDHSELFHRLEAAFATSFPVIPRRLPRPEDLDQALAAASPIAILILALHLKLVTQQHYLACVRGDEGIEPRFLQLLREHWSLECGAPRAGARGATGNVEIQRALGSVLPGRIPAGLRDYRLLVFACDDVLQRQAALDVASLEELRGAPFSPADRALVLKGEVASHRKTFLTVGIVNAAFVYAMRSLGPSAPSMLAGVVSALGTRS